jgi:ABC-type multidrug transport system fused ATPase/permease subunit
VSSLTRLLRDLAPLFPPRTRRRLRFAVVGSIVMSFAEIVGLLVILPLIEMLSGASTKTGTLGRISAFFGHPSDGTLATILAAILLGAYLSKGIANIAFRWWLLGFLNGQEARNSAELLRRYLAAPYLLHLERNSSEMVRTLNEAIVQVYSNVVLGLLSALAEGSTVLAIVGVLLVVRPEPALIAIVYFGAVGIGFSRLVKRQAGAAGERFHEAAGEMYQSAFHAIGGVKEIKVRQRMAHFADAFESNRLRFGAAKQSVQFLTDIPRYVLEVMFYVGIALLTVIVYQTSNSEQVVGELALFVAAGFRVLPSLIRLLASVNAVRSGRRGLDLVVSDLRELPPFDPDTAEGSDGDRLPLAERVRFDHVSFRYPSSEEDVLHDLDFEVPAGQYVALVGQRVPCKRPLVDGVLGLHVLERGRVLVDDVDVATCLPDWQRSIGLVPQDVYLLDASLRTNIAFGEEPEDIDDDRVAEAVRLAQLDELVTDLPEGISTFVGERGVRISGGQRQRIGIARALYRDPEILVLDEATSALDNETERRIIETIESLQGRLTIVVIAHRLSTVRNCDKLVFLEAGQVAAQGTFSEVEESNETFAMLVRLGRLGGATDVDPESILDEPLDERVV